VRRLIPAAVAAAMLLTGCRRHEVIHPEPTEEGSVSLSPVVNMADLAVAMQLVRGFHEVEQNAWRWTMGKFAITLRPPEGAAQKGAKLVMQFSIPDASIQKLGPVTVTATTGTLEVGRLTMKAGGQYTFDAVVPATELQRETVTFDFALDKFLAAGTLDGRELGIIVSSIGLLPN
jgi:hypothetical protein